MRKPQLIEAIRKSERPVLAPPPPPSPGIDDFVNNILREGNFVLNYLSEEGEVKEYFENMLRQIKEDLTLLINQN